MRFVIYFLNKSKKEKEVQELKKLGLDLLREEKQPRVTKKGVKRGTRKWITESSPAGYKKQEKVPHGRWIPKMNPHIGLRNIYEFFPS